MPGLHEAPRTRERAEAFHGDVEADDLDLDDLPSEWIELGEVGVVGYVEPDADEISTHIWPTPRGQVLAADGWILIRDPSMRVTDLGLEHD